MATTALWKRQHVARNFTFCSGRMTQWREKSFDSGVDEAKEHVRGFQGHLAGSFVPLLID
ncbi:unnamed protein product [Cyberlindnera jadinii]|uniref:Uncharacterized protein n=1 Tax=Cyberlindnera jadinii (strain ATCC 18201 / CBS 1600 / BCRC 20928 / JCM 3617 / NBRC 0987 / NRRL Y-1542) TaxID=983966 RepID=A0A0H5C8Q1_CYBJN|nr:unnamed protein product [Cyberlindnera jadinii]